MAVEGKPVMGQASMLGRKSGVAIQITNIQPNALAVHCHAHSLSLTERVLAWMNSSHADDVDVTALKTELLAFKEIFKEKASHLDEIQRALEETTSDTWLLFPNVILCNSTATHKPRRKGTPERSFSVARRFKCCS